MTSERHRDASDTQRVILVVLVTLGIIFSALRFDVDVAASPVSEALGILGIVVKEVTVDNVSAIGGAFDFNPFGDVLRDSCAPSELIAPGRHHELVRGVEKREPDAPRRG